MKHFAYNRTLHLTAQIQTLEGAPFDPVNVTFRLRRPNGTSATYQFSAGEVARLGVGVYRLTLVANQVGVWVFDVDARATSFEAVMNPPGEFVVDEPAVR